MEARELLKKQSTGKIANVKYHETPEPPPDVNSELIQALKEFASRPPAQIIMPDTGKRRWSFEVIQGANGRLSRIIATEL